MAVLIKILLSFIKIGAFSFGGGYAVLAVIQKEIVNVNHWLSNKDFIDVVAISQVTPGPIAINSATYVGYTIKGILGSTLATLGVVLPSFVIILIIARYFTRFSDKPAVKWMFKGIRPASIGLIAAAAVSVAEGSFIDVYSWLIFLLAFILTYKDFDPILLTIISGILGIIFYYQPLHALFRL
ncbi:chromate transporter [Caldanaerobius fijiensis DSM 17918]|uniref:Chromate transporter n=1 Tax=Caldanaerobius fijiensis DSM 17918 TaxID=1121256 RepID=A0A1M4W678_9THEO|nr:chromate transporter [Caldanaerobius fijiensis]SHE76645.1 chromate transporter [Caldanaerobius fijiensis DSM 17918]